MVRADRLMGHNAQFVDVGVTLTKDYTHLPAKVGAEDRRGTWTLETTTPSVCDEADVIVLHTGCPNEWLVWNQAPIVMIVHGTPIAAFRVEQRLKGQGKSYSVYVEGSRWKRVKAMVYFWPEFKPYWDVVFPEGKSIVFDYPPVDRERFTPQGKVYEIPGYQRGRYNALIADSWRDDSDVLEILHGAIEAARRVQGLTWHLYAMEEPLGPYEHLIRTLRQLGALGAVGGRTEQIDEVYRSMDFVLSGRRSISRVIAESICCGTPVVAPHGCAVTPFRFDKDDPHSIAEAIQHCITRLETDRDMLKWELDAVSKNFDLGTYGERMTKIYEAAIRASVPRCSDSGAADVGLTASSLRTGGA